GGGGGGLGGGGRGGGRCWGGRRSGRRRRSGPCGRRFGRWWGRRSRWSRCSRLLRRAGLDEVEDVLLRHAPAPSRPLHLVRVDAVLGRDACDDGRHERLPVRRRSLGGLARGRLTRRDVADALARRGLLRRPPRRWGGGGRGRRRDP